ncbi:EamA/RhaT family transporter [Spirosoma sp. HMF4905]|uniref:EamA/RhaT family transporter n=1 Tax=Spirosoma arboris TaxID=2682092 RepID=A0A7K1SGA6_9BACT|nr:EamA/RhaT family transporter [Spirosoma arboris]MVM32783.1 EamA/RhaT family transporter [Spirosoma arboris]
MLFLGLSILLSVLLLLNFRVFPRYEVNTFQAIVFNYPVCFLTGLLLLPAGQSFSIDFSQTWTWLAFGLGVGFILTFLLSGASTQRMGITATSLANNLSLVIPVCFSLFVFQTGGKTFDALNYLGLVLAVIAVGLSTYKKEPPVVDPDSSARPASRRLGAYVLLPVAVFLFYGATNTMINYMNLRYIPSADKTIQVTLTMVIGAIVAGLLMLTVRLIQGKETFQPRSLLGAVTLGIPNFLSFYTLVLALSAFGGNGAFVYPIYNIGVILLAAIMAALFFREQLSVANRIGLALAVLAIGLISWQELAQAF